MQKICDGKLLSESRCHHIKSLSICWYLVLRSSLRLQFWVKRTFFKQNRCIRMGITTLNFSIWGGISSVLLSEIMIYGDESVNSKTDVTSPNEKLQYSYPLIDDIFMIFALNMDCWCWLVLPWEGISNECPQSIFLCQNKKIKHTRLYPLFPMLIKSGFPQCSLHGLANVMVNNLDSDLVTIYCCPRHEGCEGYNTLSNNSLSYHWQFEGSHLHSGETLQGANSYL